jgi:hypothetical protein
MSTTKTLQELETEAFAILTGMDPNSSPTAEDLSVIEGYVDPLLAQLAADQIVYIGDSGEIPNEYFLPLVRLLANVCGPRFGSPMNEDARKVDEEALRRMQRQPPTRKYLQLNDATPPLRRGAYQFG